jgi:hypothetical protein
VDDRADSLRVRRRWIPLYIPQIHPRRLGCHPLGNRQAPVERFPNGIFSHTVCSMDANQTDSRSVAAALVDLDRYRLFDEVERARIVECARQTMASDGYAMLPNFIRPAAIAAMRAEVQGGLASAHRRDILMGAYDDVASGAGPDHPSRRTSPYTMWVVATDQLPATGATLALFEWDPLTRLIADILAIPALYRVEDPLLRCVATVLREGDQHGWHFDGNDFVVSLLLQGAKAGGEFEFAPNIRSDGSENYDEARSVMDGSSTLTKRISVQPGTLMLFCGKRALHRVSPVQGDRQRIIALFSYDTEPGMLYSATTQQNAVGRIDRTASVNADVDAGA